MPLPKPSSGEQYKAFLSRFLRNEIAKKEYPDIKQRFAVAVSIWNESH